MSAVTEPNGAHVLPSVADERATTSAWAAHTAADADLRARSAAHRGLAASLRVVATERCSAARGTCGRRAAHAATFLACDHVMLLCDRDATNLQTRTTAAGGGCPVCGERGAVSWAPVRSGS